MTKYEVYPPTCILPSPSNQMPSRSLHSFIYDACFTVSNTSSSAYLPGPTPTNNVAAFYTQQQNPSKLVIHLVRHVELFQQTIYYVHRLHQDDQVVLFWLAGWLMMAEIRCGELRGETRLTQGQKKIKPENLKIYLTFIIISFTSGKNIERKISLTCHVLNPMTT